MAWDPPEHVDLDEVIEVAEEMGYLPDKSGEKYIDHLREDTDVAVMMLGSLTPTISKTSKK